MSLVPRAEKEERKKLTKPLKNGGGFIFYFIFWCFVLVQLSLSAFAPVLFRVVAAPSGVPLPAPQSRGCCVGS